MIHYCIHCWPVIAGGSVDLYARAAASPYDDHRQVGFDGWYPQFLSMMRTVERWNHVDRYIVHRSW